MNESTLLLLRQMLKTAKLTEAKLDGLLAERSLTATKLLTLRHLARSAEPVSIGALASCMAFAKSNATQLIDHLETAGLVARLPNLDDRRCTQVALTERGRKESAAGSEVARPLAEQLDSLLTPGEQARLSEYLTRIAEALS